MKGVTARLLRTDAGLKKRKRVSKQQRTIEVGSNGDLLRSASVTALRLRCFLFCRLLRRTRTQNNKPVFRPTRGTRAAPTTTQRRVAERPTEKRDHVIARNRRRTPLFETWIPSMINSHARHAAPGSIRKPWRDGDEGHASADTRRVGVRDLFISGIVRTRFVCRVASSVRAGPDPFVRPPPEKGFGFCFCFVFLSYLCGYISLRYGNIVV